MTTIAYRNGVMAADTLITSGPMRAGQCIKVGRAPDGTMGGCAGSLAASSELLAWLHAGAEGSPPKTDDDVDGIVVRPDRSIFYWSGKVLSPVAAEFVAFGSGERYAMGAMAAGADAHRAVEVAIELDTASGGEITVVRL